MRIARKAELNKGFLIIFEDNSEIKVSEEIYFRESLYEKEELSKKEIADLIFRDKVLESEIFCKKRLAGGLKPKRRLLAYMEKNEIEKAVAEKAVDNLVKNKYLDDRKYAKKRLHRKMITSPLASATLVQWLMNDGIDKETAEIVVNEAGIDDNDTAESLVVKKFSSEDRNKKKIALYLAARGFNGEIIYRIIGAEDLWNE